MSCTTLQPVFRGLRLPLLVGLAIVVAFILSGCAGRPQLVEVRVPVPIECRVDVPARPAMPTEALSLVDNLHRKVTAALAELEIREGYELELRAALQTCTKPIAPEATAR